MLHDFLRHFLRLIFGQRPWQPPLAVFFHTTIIRVTLIVVCVMFWHSNKTQQRTLLLSTLLLLSTQLLPTLLLLSTLLAIPPLCETLHPKPYTLNRTP